MRTLPTLGLLSLLFGLARAENPAGPVSLFPIDWVVKNRVGEVCYTLPVKDETAWPTCDEIRAAACAQGPQPAASCDAWLEVPGRLRIEHKTITRLQRFTSVNGAVIATKDGHTILLEEDPATMEALYLHAEQQHRAWVDCTTRKGSTWPND